LECTLRMRHETRAPDAILRALGRRRSALPSTRRAWAGLARPSAAAPVASFPIHDVKQLPARLEDRPCETTPKMSEDMRIVA
jgi:hypothetical protein